MAGVRQTEGIEIMPRRRKMRGGRRNPPGWFMPVVMAGLGAAGALLSIAMLGIVE